MSIETCYISCSSNITPSIAHWGRNNLICYGSCRAVLIYDPNIGGGKVVNTLQKHTKCVNCVKWISGADSETELISGSSDGTAIVWSYTDGRYIPSELKGHTDPVNLVDGLYKDEAKKCVLVATASADSTLIIWSRSNFDDVFLQIQSILFGYGLCLSLRLTLMNCGTVLLVYGMDDSNIEFYVENNNEFEKSEVLKGHEDWVRGLAFTSDENGDLLLASASQDNLIHLFRISEVDDGRKYNIKTTKSTYKINLESVLTGHEGWIYSVDWCPVGLKLLSASIDKTLIIWEYDASVNLWLETTRLGEVGGGTLGFYGAVFGPDGNSILAHSYHGAFHMWNFDKTADIWIPVVTVGGHFNEVVDLSWETNGEFLVSVSADQTTRIHAPWIKDGCDVVTWHEIGRPQIHGYDMNCLAILSRYKFASGGDEKVIRAFCAPDNFVQNFRRICNIQEVDHEGMAINPKGASVPSLGLSNKAVYEIDNNEQAKPKNKKDPHPEESHFTSIELNSPPTEETLIQNTLWPETQKLYGHGYEVYSLAATHDGSVLASACKATTTEHAAILLWDTSTWEQTQKLVSHTLTVAQLAFSPDSLHLLSVSRDRRWSLFTKYTDSNKYELVATTDKKTGIHTRIIWCCAWTHDSKYFATGSRDGKIVVWMKNTEKRIDSAIGQYGPASEYMEIKGASITALAFAPDLIQGKYLIAVGLENGLIYLYNWMKDWRNILILDNSFAHHMTVKRLVFRPILGRAGMKVADNSHLQLASCSSDHSVKIFDINITML